MCDLPNEDVGKEVKKERYISTSNSQSPRWEFILSNLPNDYVGKKESNRKINICNAKIMNRKFVRILIATFSYTLFGISYLIYSEGAEKDKNDFFPVMVISGVCFALFTVYIRRYEKQYEIYEERIDEENTQYKFKWKKLLHIRTFTAALVILSVFLIFLTFIIVNNGSLIFINILRSKWYYVIGFPFVVPLFYFGSVYLGHLLLKLMWGNNYEHDAVTGLKKLRIFFGAGAIIVLFYISLWIYNSLK